MNPSYFILSASTLNCRLYFTIVVCDTALHRQMPKDIRISRSTWFCWQRSDLVYTMPSIYVFFSTLIYSLMFGDVWIISSHTLPGMQLFFYVNLTFEMLTVWATACIFDTWTDIRVNVSKFLRQKMYRPEGECKYLSMLAGILIYTMLVQVARGGGTHWLQHFPRFLWIYSAIGDLLLIFHYL